MNKSVIAQNGVYFITTDRDAMDIGMIHRYLSEDSYWAKNIPVELVRKSVGHSLCFGVFETESQIGFARVITDTTSFAYLADVFILPDHRGKGLSKWLMKTIHAHPDLQGLRRWLLFTVMPMACIVSLVGNRYRITSQAVSCRYITPTFTWYLKKTKPGKLLNNPLIFHQSCLLSVNFAALYVTVVFI